VRRVSALLPHQCSDFFPNPALAGVSMVPLVPHHAHCEAVHREGGLNQLQLAAAVTHEPFWDQRYEIGRAHDFGYEAHAVFFDVPAEVCMERNRRRDRNVPEDVMRRMASKLRPPKFEEGFAKITVVRLKKKEDESEGKAEQPRQEFAIGPDEGERPAIVDSEHEA